MRLAEMRQHEHHGGPDEDEEDDYEDEDVPLRNVDTPEEAPVTTVGL